MRARCEASRQRFPNANEETDGSGRRAAHDRRPVDRTPNLAPKYSHFVTKSQQFHLVGMRGTQRQDAGPNQTPDGEIDESPQLSPCFSPSHCEDGSREGCGSGKSLVAGAFTFSDTTRSHDPEIFITMIMLNRAGIAPQSP